MYATTEGATCCIRRSSKCRDGRREHVLENLRVTPVSPVTHEQFLRRYQ